MTATATALPRAISTLDWTWSGRRVVVMGLGSFGGTLGAIRWLARQGARVTVTDRADPSRLQDSCKKIADLDVKLTLGCHHESDLDGAELMVVSPAVNKAHSDFFHTACQRGIPWTSEMNLFLERCPACIVGVTGSAGKSTVCAMIHAIVERAIALDQAPFDHAWLGGNIGRSLLDDLPQMTERQLAVLELSSFQLEDSAGIYWQPHVAVITNVTPNHLDRHRTFESYFDAKLNLIRARRQVQFHATHVICGTNDVQVVSNLTTECASRGFRLDLVTYPSAGYSLNLPGGHNQGNAHVAATACAALGVESGTARDALSNFVGLPHRLQHVRTLNGVDYYNDSKATTPREAVMALEAFDRPIVAIVGGQRRIGGEWRELADALRRRTRVVIFTGECGVDWYTEARREGWPNAFTLQRDKIADAVTSAAHLAHAGDVVLLTPGAPSYDQFRNYEDRGQCFQIAVRGLGA